MSLTRIISIVLYVAVVIITVVSFAYLLGSGATGDAEIDKANSGIQKGAAIGLGLSYVLGVIAVILALVIGPVLGIINNPKSIIGVLVGLGALLVIFLIGYAIADDTVTPMYERMYVTTPGMSKLVGGMLNSVYILIFVAFAVYIYSSINSLLKNL
ncbi:MAG TPA: hypothetical protein VEC12_01335 [Bacteroidia bacterium]|nr:hypothetical protein [Bacteroidia bacterium]